MSSIPKIRIAILFLIVLICNPACQKLDDEGGYYDEKTGLYKYVFPNRKKGINTADLKIKTPQPGVEQQIQGVITEVGKDLKSVWIFIKSRQTYMILAESLARGNRNDKEKKSSK